MKYVHSGVVDQSLSSARIRSNSVNLSEVCTMVLRNVVGKEVVETMSPEFVGFIQDAYRSLRWGKK